MNNGSVMRVGLGKQVQANEKVADVIGKKGAAVAALISDFVQFTTAKADFFEHNFNLGIGDGFRHCLKILNTV